MAHGLCAYKDVEEEMMKNIKLICSDVDGTLVPDGTSQLNAELYDIILQLKEKGIHFAAASGRQVISLEKLFDPVKDKIFYLAENGAYIGCYGRELFTRSMDGEDIRLMIRDIHEHMPDCDIMLSGPRKAYTDSVNPVFLKFLLEGYRYALDEVEELEKLEGNFIKLALYRENIPTEYLIFLREKWGNRYKIVTSGDMWIDILDIHANKGLAVKELQESLSITPEETMVFGDQQNDIEMIRQAYYSYAVANALPETRAAARFITDSSTDDGVLKVLKELLKTMSEKTDE